MNIIQFSNVSYTYPPLAEDDAPSEVFRDLSIDVPAGITSLVGQNGTGKSTFLLLAGARLFPDNGNVSTMGTNTSVFRNSTVQTELEEQRNALISFVYQNMEFETDESIGDLFEFIYAHGYREEKPADLLQLIIKSLELEKELGYKTQELSKGALQRTIIGFSLLYGSPLLIMDEPVFALEEARKERVFRFLQDFVRDQKINLLYSAHELHLTRKFSDQVILFHKKDGHEIGPTEEMLQRDKLEQAYQVPLDMLYQRENLYREALLKSRG
ncbi:ATP-binding cassette domain-containing protein [Spirochaeta dissipatitropha]